MKKKLLNYLCDPNDKSELILRKAKYNELGNIEEGLLVSKSGHEYPILNGIPRFVSDKEIKKTVDSFGNEWNFFNFDMFKLNWLKHTIKNTFTSIDIFKGKIIVDAGAGSGMQSKWMSEAGAKYVISLEMSTCCR